MDNNKIAIVNMDQLSETDQEWLKIYMESQKYSILHFGAEWCGFCKKLQAKWENEKIKSKLKDKDVELNILDADKEEDKSKFKKYKITSYPTVVFIDGNGNEILRFSGDISLEKLENLIDKYIK